MPCAALERHPAVACAALRGIEASVARTADGGLKVVYVLDGEIERLRIPPPRPARIAERLWQHTCCEIFIARKDQRSYHEFNLSPSGEWAAYAFARYRKGALLDDPALDPRIAVNRGAHRLELCALVPVEDQGKLLIGLAAVVEDKEGTLSYWALRHAAGKPDFHHPQAFAMELDEVRH
jgi:hypothetical protein